MTIFRSLVFYLLNDLAYLNCDVFFSELRTWLQVGKRKLDIEDETTYCDEEVLTKLVTFYKSGEIAPMGVRLLRIRRTRV